MPPMPMKKSVNSRGTSTTPAPARLCSHLKKPKNRKNMPTSQQAQNAEITKTFKRDWSRAARKMLREAMRDRWMRRAASFMRVSSRGRLSRRGAEGGPVPGQFSDGRLHVEVGIVLGPPGLQHGAGAVPEHKPGGVLRGTVPPKASAHWVFSEETSSSR